MKDFIIHSSFFIFHFSLPSMITREQLDHLCMLTALDLIDAEKDAMLPQLSNILDFVGQVNSFEIQETNTGSKEYRVPSTTALEATE
jgi:hypothetical protein